MKHQAPRGTRDLLPGEIERWQWAEAQAHAVLERYGFAEIRTPIFEDFELFARTSGESSDVVQKEMYHVKALGDRDLALRPEATASVCRAYLEHGLGGRGRIHRLWYLGPMFRFARPQKGRYRQFFQVGAEIIGTPEPGADVEIIALFVDLFDAWGFKDLSVLINSVGTPESRRTYVHALRQWLEPVRDQLSKESQARLETNPMRILDSKDEGDLTFLRGEGGIAPAPRMLDVLDAADRMHFDAVLAGLTTLGIRYEIDHGLVRGLDYYTRTAFEVHDRSLGAQSALGGGGRYDGLIEALGGPATTGVGFSIGLDRVLHVVGERGDAAVLAAPAVFVVAMDATREPALKLLRELRRVCAAIGDLEAKGFGAQMRAAGKSGARFMALLGEDEWKKGEVLIKDLTSGEQETVAADRLVARVLERLAQPSRAPAAH